MSTSSSGSISSSGSSSSSAPVPSLINSVNISHKVIGKVAVSIIHSSAKPAPAKPASAKPVVQLTPQQIAAFRAALVPKPEGFVGSLGGLPSSVERQPTPY